MKGWLLCLVFIFHRCDSLPKYQLQLPNGDFTGLLQTRSLGHFNPSSRQSFIELNQFAIDFQKAAYKWTLELCEADSDGDGFTNGVELGDPNCIFDFYNITSRHLIERIKSHPADETSTPEAPNLDAFQSHKTDKLALYIHCWCLGMSWIVLFPSGVITVWTQKMKPRTEWVTKHAIFMSTAAFLSLSGIAVIAILGSGPVSVLEYSLHGQLGLATILLMLLNWTAAITKPCDGVKPQIRWFWEVVHSSIGRTLLTMSPFTLLTGFRIGFPDAYEKIGFTAIVIGVVVLFLALYGVALLISYCNWRDFSLAKNAEARRTVEEEYNDRELAEIKAKQLTAEQGEVVVQTTGLNVEKILNRGKYAIETKEKNYRPLPPRPGLSETEKQKIRASYDPNRLKRLQKERMKGRKTKAIEASSEYEL